MSEASDFYFDTSRFPKGIDDRDSVVVYACRSEKKTESVFDVYDHMLYARGIIDLKDRAKACIND